MRRLEVDFEECFGGFMVTLRKTTPLVTPQVAPQVTPLVAPQVTPQVLELLGVLREEKGLAALLAVLGLRDQAFVRSASTPHLRQV
jgi:hypothetical protein